MVSEAGLGHSLSSIGIHTADISSSHNVEQVLQNIDYRAFTAQCVRRGKTDLSFQLFSSREETTLNHLLHLFTFIYYLLFIKCPFLLILSLEYEQFDLPSWWSISSKMIFKQKIFFEGNIQINVILRVIWTDVNWCSIGPFRTAQ